MTDNLQLGIFAAIILAFVVCGCLATRRPKKKINTDLSSTGAPSTKSEITER